MIRAYDEDYLEAAQRNLGDMMDFAVNSCDFSADEYFRLFLMSGIAEQFERCNPTFVTGMTGCELVKKVVAKSGLQSADNIEDEMYMDKSPEYWSGWALAYYQWYTAKTFEEIYKAVTMEEICQMYPTLHEADIMKFVEIMNAKIQEFYKETKLKILRKNAGLSQKELAQRADIPLRLIQLFEQRQRDINKTQAINLWAISKVLGCEIRDLLEF